LLPVFDEDLGAVGEPVALALAARIVDEQQLAVAIHHHAEALLLHNLAVLELDRAFVSRLERRLLGAHLTDAADVERAHGQLRTRLADRLRGDHAHRLADVHHVAACEIASITEDADAAPSLAGEHRADLHLIDASRIDLADLVLVNLLVLRHQHFARVGVDHVLERDTAEDAVGELLDDLAAFDERRHLDALHRAA